jgi:di/tricarboxylate transporter
MVLADRGFADRWRDRSDFLVVSRLGGSPPAVTRKAPIVAAITALVVLAAGSGLLPILESAIVGAFMMVLFRVLTPGEARGAVDLDVIVLIAASFGVGLAIEKTGLAAMVARGLVDAFASLGTTGAVLGVALATVALTEIVTNNAAAVILFPIGFQAATVVDADPRAFAVVVAIAASASFLTPIGYQTNTMVYGPGGYRFSDYARLGFPLTIIVLAVLVVGVPLLWGL